jgi:phosphoribosylaminoimidazolecarboxamide formyltransferase/IMP cyclohydrolase
MAEDLKAAYRTIMDDHFPDHLEISFGSGKDRQTLVYEKMSWVVDNVKKGLRYGENPGQEAALYKLTNGNLAIGDVRLIGPGEELVCGATLHQFGKHPGKINLTDADNALNILRYLTESPCAVIVKHNNPCGVAPWPRHTCRPTWPTGWPPSAVASPSTARWTGPPPGRSPSATPRWWWRRASRKGPWTY